MPDEVERLAPAKINLALHVVGRRVDGYHDLDTLAVFADRGDRVTVSPGEGLTLSVFGPLADHAPPGADNLVLRAAKLLKEYTTYPGWAAIRLDKHIPAGAGLGGGSSDAAATLHALNELWGLGLGLHDLISLGGRLGADLPMCLVGRALRAEGTGERIALHPGVPTLPMVLVWPGKPVSTPAVFAGLERRDNPPMSDPAKCRTPAEMADWLQSCRNDLEGPALLIAPEIGDALGSLLGTPGCLLARMSGSGSACFAIYTDPAKAESAALILREARPNWWVQPALAG